MWTTSVAKVPEITSEPPDADTRAAVLRLVDRIEAEDGAPPLSDQTLAQLRSPNVEHFLARAGGAVVGYAQRSARTHAEIAAEPEAVRPLLDAVTGEGVLVWSHGRRSRLTRAVEEHGFARARELHQLRRPLDTLPDAPPLPPDITVRAFEPGRDDDAWLAVNAAAFATHPEQGSWTHADLRARIDEPWFDAAGFLLAVRDAELLGYHWTKVHPDGIGEVYVLGISPSAQGLGLGRALLVRGLQHLKARGCPAVLLYVDGDNGGAIRLYEKSGFAPYDLDVQWRAPA